MYDHIINHKRQGNNWNPYHLEKRRKFEDQKERKYIDKKTQNQNNGNRKILSDQEYLKLKEEYIKEESHTAAIFVKAIKEHEALNDTPNPRFNRSNKKSDDEQEIQSNKSESDSELEPGEIRDSKNELKEEKEENTAKDTKIQEIKKIENIESPKETEESIFEIINQKTKEIAYYKEKLEAILKNKKTKQLKYYYLEENNNSNIYLPNEQVLLFKEDENIAKNITNLLSFFNQTKPFDTTEYLHINLFIYKYAMKPPGELEYKIDGIFSSLQTKISVGTILFEVQNSLPLPLDDFPVIYQYPADLNGLLKVDSLYKRSNYSLVTYNPNVAISSGISTNTVKSTLFIHKISSEIKAVSISDTCASFDLLAALLLDKNITIKILSIEDNRELPSLNIVNPRLRQENRSMRIVYTEIIKLE